MNVIQVIYQRLHNKVYLYGENTFESLIESANILQTPFSEKDLIKIKAFAAKLEPVYNPGLKTIYDEQTTLAIWRVCNWVIRTERMLYDIMNILNHYCSFGLYSIKLEYDENDSWLISFYDEMNMVTHKKCLDYYFGIELAEEIIGFAKTIKDIRHGF